MPYKYNKIVWEPPKNESSEHYLLKQVARIVLYNRGYYFIAEEMFIRGLMTDDTTRTTIDMVAVDKKKTHSYGIEVKVSLADFKSGFCDRCNYTSILCPEGVIPKELIPDHVGLIYCNLDKLMYVTNAKDSIIKGVTTIKKAKFCVNLRYWIDDDTYNNDFMLNEISILADQIGRANVNELMFHSNRVPMYKQRKCKNAFHV